MGALRKRDVESADGLGLLSTTHPFAAYGRESEIYWCFLLTHRSLENDRLEHIMRGIRGDFPCRCA
jgi:hypothetical protein